jgi:pimeloyl-ACP methyl ester carboxylesterase
MTRSIGLFSTRRLGGFNLRSSHRQTQSRPIAGGEGLGDKIAVPTLIIHAEWDADLPSAMAEAYFAKLTNAPYKRFVELGEGTHTVMLEKNRMQFFHEILGFLDESDATAMK